MATATLPTVPVLLDTTLRQTMVPQVGMKCPPVDTLITHVEDEKNRSSNFPLSVTLIYVFITGNTRKQAIRSLTSASKLEGEVTTTTFRVRRLFR